MLPISDVPSYNLLSLNVKIPEKPLNRGIPSKKGSPDYGEWEKILTYMLRSHDTMGMKRNFNTHKETSSCT